MKRMIRTALVFAAFTAAASAETVYLSPHGKTFHRTESCMALSRTTNKLTADRRDAESHGLKACGICFRATKSKKSDNGAWAKGAGK